VECQIGAVRGGSVRVCVVSVFEEIGRRFVWAVLFASMAAFGLSFLGRMVPEFDLLADARGHLAGLALAAYLALILGYRPVMVLAMGAFLTLATHSLIAQRSDVPLIGAAQASPGAASKDSWTVLTLNTWHHHPDQDVLAAYLMSSGADVLVLTELGPNKFGLLQALESTYPYRKDCADTWDCSLAVLSRHPFTGSGEAAATDGSPARAWISFGAGKDQLTIMGAQLTDALRWPRTHRLQMHELAGMAQRLPGQLLVAGDFNTTPWSAAYEDFTAVSGLTPMGRFLPSYPAGDKGLPQLAIDHMFGSSAVRFQEVWLGPDVQSMHRPLLARVALPRATLAALR
jgi:endonuclease/exonuclease/phosphatase (EEP) superfamily protein YafD